MSAEPRTSGGACIDASLLERVAPLVPAIRERATDAESQRRVPVETIRALTSTGLFRALVPRRFGGDGRDLLTVHEALIELATACASTAWVGGLFAFHAIMVRWFDERAQREIWGDSPDTLVASSVAPLGRVTRVGEQFRLDGQWPLSSGINHAKWVMVLANEAAPSEPVRSRACLVPVEDCTILDDWHAAGMKGTGSHSIIMRSVLAPAYRTEPMAAVNEGTARGMIGGSPLARRTWRPVVNYSFCPVAIGCALETIRLFREYTSIRKAANTGELYRDKATILIRLGESVGEVDLARMVLRRDMRAIEDCDRLSAASVDSVIARVSYGSAHIAELCSRAVARLFRGSGGHAVYERNPLQRLFRDVHTITQHAGLDFDVAREQYGRTLIENLYVAVD
jgi:alkylation response protein AidB-like acyl-CoA dehydrogenase